MLLEVKEHYLFLLLSLQLLFAPLDFLGFLNNLGKMVLLFPAAQTWLVDGSVLVTWSF